MQTHLHILCTLALEAKSSRWHVTTKIFPSIWILSLTGIPHTALLKTHASSHLKLSASIMIAVTSCLKSKPLPSQSKVLSNLENLQHCNWSKGHIKYIFFIVSLIITEKKTV